MGSTTRRLVLAAVIVLATACRPTPVKEQPPIAVEQCRPTPDEGAAVGTVQSRDATLAGVTVEYDLAYGPDAYNRLDVYSPAGDDPTPRPLVVWLSSGGFISTIRGQAPHPEYASRLVGHGYVVAMVDYRVCPAMPIEATMFHCPPRADVRAAADDAKEDAHTALGWLRGHAGEYGIDPDRIAVAGISAGGMTALGVNYDDPGGADVVAAISLEGYALDLDAIDADDGPALLVHSSDDTGVPFACAQATHDRAIQVGAASELVAGSGEHGFTTNVDVAIDDIVEFLFEHLAAP